MKFRKNQNRSPFRTRAKNWLKGPHPLATGLGVGAGMILAGMRFPVRSIAVTNAQTLRAARKVFPQIERLARSRGGSGIRTLPAMLRGKAGGVGIGGAYFPRYSILPKSVMRQALGVERGPVLFRNPAGGGSGTLAHELGHAAYHLKRPRLERAKGVGLGVSGALTRTGLGLAGSVGAHKAISRSNLSEKRKRQLRIAATALPVAVTAPLLLDEAMAWRNATKIFKAARAAKKPMRAHHALNVANMLMQGGQAAPTFAGGALYGREQLRRGQRRAAGRTRARRVA